MLIPFNIIIGSQDYIYLFLSCEIHVSTKQFVYLRFHVDSQMRIKCTLVSDAPLYCQRIAVAMPSLNQASLVDVKLTYFSEWD